MTARCTRPKSGPKVTSSRSGGTPAPSTRRRPGRRRSSGSGAVWPGTAGSGAKRVALEYHATFSVEPDAVRRQNEEERNGAAWHRPLRPRSPQLTTGLNNDLGTPAVQPGYWDRGKTRRRL